MVDDLGGTQEHASPLLGGQQFNRPGRIAIGHEYDSPHASAYGTNHPVDIKLGRARRWANLAATARGKSPSSSETLHAAASIRAEPVHPQQLYGGTQ